MKPNNWFTSYCVMSKEEQELYREFVMEPEQAIRLSDYQRMYEAVLLLASDCETQLAALPQGVPAADEIALGFEAEVVVMKDVLSGEGMLSEAACAQIEKINRILSDMSGQNMAVLWTPDALARSSQWEMCRNEARQLFSLLYPII